MEITLYDDRWERNGVIQYCPFKSVQPLCNDSCPAFSILSGVYARGPETELNLACFAAPVDFVVTEDRRSSNA